MSTRRGLPGLGLADGAIARRRGGRRDRRRHRPVGRPRRGEHGQVAGARHAGRSGADPRGGGRGDRGDRWPTGTAHQQQRSEALDRGARPRRRTRARRSPPTCWRPSAQCPACGRPTSTAPWRGWWSPWPTTDPRRPSFAGSSPTPNDATERAPAAAPGQPAGRRRAADGPDGRGHGRLCGPWPFTDRQPAAAAPAARLGGRAADGGRPPAAAAPRAGATPRARGHRCSVRYRQRRDGRVDAVADGGGRRGRHPHHAGGRGVERPAGVVSA